MKVILRRLLLGALMLSVAGQMSHAEGFLAGTLVKVPGGYKAIETLNTGDDVCCRNKAGEEEVRSITATKAQHPSSYLALKVDGQEVVTEDAQLFMSCEQTKVSASNLTPATPLVSADAKASLHLAQAPSVPAFDKAPLLYNIAVKEHHTFFVTKKDICVHNNVASFAFGFKKPAPIVAPKTEAEPIEYVMPENPVGKSAFRGPGERPAPASSTKMYSFAGSCAGRGSIWTGNCDAAGNPLKTQEEKDAAYYAQVVADSDRSAALKKEADDAKAPLMALISKKTPASKKIDA